MRLQKCLKRGSLFLCALVVWRLNDALAILCELRKILIDTKS